MIPFLSERAIILAPNGRDSAIAASLLHDAGIRSVVTRSLGELAVELEKGAGFALLTEEGLRSANLGPWRSGWTRSRNGPISPSFC